MKPLSKLELVHAGLIVLALVFAMFALGIPGTPEQVGLVLLGVLAFSVLSWFALGKLLPAAHWRHEVSEAAGRRVMAMAVSAPFYLTAIALAVVVVMAYLKTKH